MNAFKTLIFTILVPGMVAVPMYIGVLSLVLGQALWFEALTLFLYSGSVFLLFNLFVLLYEEPALKRKFGEVYPKYCEAVPRWIPRPGGWPKGTRNRS